jgi:hypothetical protein
MCVREHNCCLPLSLTRARTHGLLGVRRTRADEGHQRAVAENRTNNETIPLICPHEDGHLVIQNFKRQAIKAFLRSRTPELPEADGQYPALNNALYWELDATGPFSRRGKFSERAVVAYLHCASKVPLMIAKPRAHARARVMISTHAENGRCQPGRGSCR